MESVNASLRVAEFKSIVEQCQTEDVDDQQGDHHRRVRWGRDPHIDWVGCLHMVSAEDEEGENATEE